MAKKKVTLYIDDSYIRLLVTRGTQIKKWAELPLDLGGAKATPAGKESEIVSKIKQILKYQKVHDKKVIVGVSGLHCLTRPVTLPRLPKAMLEEAVLREAKRVLPTPPEQLYISWQVMSEAADAMRVFLVAIPRNTADSLLKILHQAGIKPEMMDLKPLAVARVVKEKTAIIVDVQPTEFDIVVMSEGIPQPVRTVTFPGEADSMSAKLLMIRDDINRTIEFYNSNNPQNKLGTDVAIFVSGDLVDEPDLCKALSNEIEHPVIPLPSPLKHPQAMNPSRYMGNIGLSLKEQQKDAGPSAVNINILPSSYRPKPISLMRIIVVPGVVVAASIIIFLSMLIQDAAISVASTQGQLDITNNLIQQKQAQKKELTDSNNQLEGTLAQAQASYKSFNAAVNAINGRSAVINGDLKLSVNSLAGTIALAGISHSGERLSISGTASNEDEILSYTRALDDSGRFSEVIVSSIRKVEDQKAFTLILKTGDGG